VQHEPGTVDAALPHLGQGDVLCQPLGAVADVGLRSSASRSARRAAVGRGPARKPGRATRSPSAATLLYPHHRISRSRQVPPS
jgi:hypothetical protein